MSFAYTTCQPGAEAVLKREIGRLRPDALFDYRFVSLSHNTVRGAAGGAVLTAELLTADGFIQPK